MSVKATSEVLLTFRVCRLVAGVEAGKKAAAEVLALQKRVLIVLNDARLVQPRPFVAFKLRGLCAYTSLRAQSFMKDFLFFNASDLWTSDSKNGENLLIARSL